MEEGEKQDVEHIQSGKTTKVRSPNKTAWNITDLPNDSITTILNFTLPGYALKGRQMFHFLECFNAFSLTCVRFSNLVSDPDSAPKIESIDTLYPMKLNENAHNVRGNPSFSKFKALLLYCSRNLKELHLRPTDSVKEVIPILLEHSKKLEQFEFEDNFENDHILSYSKHRAFFSSKSTLRRLQIFRPRVSLQILGPMPHLESIALTGLSEDKVGEVCTCLTKFCGTLRHMKLTFRCCFQDYKDFIGTFSPIFGAITGQNYKFEVMESVHFGVCCTKKPHECDDCYREREDCIDFFTFYIFHDFKANRQELEESLSGVTYLQCLESLELAVPSCQLKDCFRLFRPLMRNNVQVSFEAEFTGIVYPRKGASKDIFYRYIAFNVFNIGHMPREWKEILREVKSLHLGESSWTPPGDFFKHTKIALEAAKPLNNLERIVFDAGRLDYLAYALMRSPRVTEIEAPFTAMFRTAPAHEEVLNIFSKAKSVRVLYLLQGEGNVFEFLKGLGPFLRDTARVFPNLEAICYSGNANFQEIGAELSQILEELQPMIRNFARVHPHVDIRSIQTLLEI